MSARAVVDDGELAEQIALAVPWVHAAGQPYFDWLIGGSAVRTLVAWMRRPSSEVYAGRIVTVDDGAHPVGGFIALSGAELAQCRLHDAVAAAAAASPQGRSALAQRLRRGRVLFPDVAAGDFHLSRIGVLLDARRRGYGRTLVREFLETGARRGFRRFTLDVSADNAAAIELYRSAGFREERRQQLRDAGMTYVRMALELPA